MGEILRHAAETSPKERKEGFRHQNQVRSYCSTGQTPSRAVGTFDHWPRGSAFHGEPSSHGRNDGPPLGRNVRSSFGRNVRSSLWRNVWSSVWWRNDGRRNVRSSVWRRNDGRRNVWSSVWRRDDGRRFQRNEPAPWADEKALVDAFMICI